MPGPCRPIELSMPLGVSAIRGVARPDRAFSMIDLVTTPPSSARSKNWASSRPAAAQPDAVSTGLGSAKRASVVDMSTTAVDAGSALAARTVIVLIAPALARRAWRARRPRAPSRAVPARSWRP